MIDLHCHSHFSDGVLSPQALLDKALAAKISILALTDHDTMAGVNELVQAAINQPIQIIKGLELSARWKKNDIHIVGLKVDPESRVLQNLISLQNENRIQRAKQIAEQIKSCGLADAYTKACELAGHERIGRPHFARLLVNEGLVSDMQMAFKRYLGRGKAAYVPTNWIDIEQAVEVINSSGGQAVFAHPLKYGFTRTRLNELVAEFKAAGGIGMEVVSGEMTTDQINEVAGLCSRYDLLASSGSDYHGDTISRVSLGRQQLIPGNCVSIWQKWNL